MQQHHSMKKIYGLDDWLFDTKTPPSKRIASVRIHLKYIDVKKVEGLTPKKRVIAVDNHFKERLSKLLATGMFESYKLIGSKKRPTGIETTILAGDLAKLARYTFIWHVFINAMKGAKKVIKKKEPGFYCIKMTVAIQVEEATNGLQTYEERYVLIKAKSPDDAYKKIERQKKSYESPHLNPYGQFVRWKIESLDDCYTTDIVNSDDLNKPEGAEVFSILKRRKLTKERYWDGKNA